MRYERQDTDTPLESVEQVTEEKSKKKVHVRHLFYKVTDLSSFCIVLFIQNQNKFGCIVAAVISLSFVIS